MEAGRSHENRFPAMMRRFLQNAPEAQMYMFMNLWLPYQHLEWLRRSYQASRRRRRYGKFRIFFLQLQHSSDETGIEKSWDHHHHGIRAISEGRLHPTHVMARTVQCNVCLTGKLRFIFHTGMCSRMKMLASDCWRPMAWLIMREPVVIISDWCVLVSKEVAMCDLLSEYSIQSLYREKASLYLQCHL